MLKPENTCLLVIDLQERLMPVISGNEEMIKRCAALIKGMKLLDVPILVTQQYTKGLGPTVPQIAEALGEFEPIEKITFSCVADEGFRQKLSECNRENIVVVGAEAHICVQQTVLDLFGLLNLLGSDYLREVGANDVYLVVDCVGSRHDVDKTYALERMKKLGATFTTLEAVLFELLYTAEHPHRKEIQALVMDL